MSGPFQVGLGKERPGAPPPSPGSTQGQGAALPLAAHPGAGDTGASWRHRTALQIGSRGTTDGSAGGRGSAADPWEAIRGGCQAEAGDRHWASGCSEGRSGGRGCFATTMEREMFVHRRRKGTRDTPGSIGKNILFNNISGSIMAPGDSNPVLLITMNDMISGRKED